MKRAFDLLFAAFALAVTSPLLLIAAIGIRMSSPGPVFYRAKRVACGSGTFEMLKFRSMHARAGGPVITSHGDRRIFPFGSFLRKSKIDELPQFLNVLKGDMSIVGPRPEDPGIVAEHYTDWMIETLDVKPGITSPGAIYYYALGERLIDPDNPEQSYVERTLKAKLAVERAYLERANLISDFQVVVRTALAIIGAATGRIVQPDARDLAGATRWAPSSFVTSK